MKNNIITISDNGIVTVPDNVKMRDFEVAQLFGVYAQTIWTNVKSILKSGICQGDFSGGVVYGNMILPEFYGLDMITAIAFRIESPQATIFREWVIRKISYSENRIATNQQIYISIDKSANRFIN